jgi:hypothetical protein
MLDMMGSILVGVALAAILTAIMSFVTLRLSSRLILAGAAGTWVGFAGAVAGAGALSNPLTVLAMFGTPLVAGAAIVPGVPAARRAFSAIPLPMLIGLNAVRLGGILFLMLALADRLSGPFPYLAGVGDFVTGALAIPVAWLAARERGLRDRSIVAWNAFGTVDLIVAVTLVLISRNGSPLQLIHAGVGSAAMQTLPWAFAPMVLVPFFLIVHGVVFARMGARRPDTVDRRPASIGDLSHAH